MAAEIIFFLFKIGESMLDPSVRLYIYQGVCFREFHNDTTCYRLKEFPDREDQIQNSSANYIMYYKLLLNCPAILLGLFCGAWSDKIGRKLPVMMTSFGTILAVMCYMLSMVMEEYGPYLPFVLVGAAIRGAFGKSAVMTMALHSYISDTSTPTDRTQRLGRLLGMNFFGYFVGSLTAGALLSVSSFDVIFCVVVFVNSLCVLVAVVFMKESVYKPPLDDDDATDADPDADTPPLLPTASADANFLRRIPFRWEHVQESLGVLTRQRFYARGRSHLLLLFAGILLQQLCKSGETDASLLFVERAPLSWDKSMYGYLLAVDYACLGMAVLVLLPLLIHRGQLGDMTLILMGILFKILRLLLLSVSDHTWLVYMAVVVGCPSAMIVSGIKSLISKSVEEGEMGKVFSLLSCGETIANMLGSVTFTALYVSTLHLYPGKKILS